MREPRDVPPEDYDLFVEAIQAVDDWFGDGEDFDNLDIEDPYSDDEYVSEEDDFPEGLQFGENYSEASTEDEDLNPTGLVDGETENRLPPPENEN